MKYVILYKRSASDELLLLPANKAIKVKSAIDKLAENPRPHGCVKLTGLVNEYRIRVDNYRIIYTIADSVLIVTVIRIAHRKDVYR